MEIYKLKGASECKDITFVSRVMRYETLKLQFSHTSVIVEALYVRS